MQLSDYNFIMQYCFGTIIPSEIPKYNISDIGKESFTLGDNKIQYLDFI